MKKILFLSTVTSLFFFSGHISAQVGINVDSPAATLDILSAGSTSTTKALLINNSSSTNLLTILDNGYVGINQSAPTTYLHVTGSQINPTLQTSASIATFRASNGALDLFAYSRTPYGLGFQARDFSQGTSLPIVLNPLGGRVGIGTITPNTGALLDLTSTSKGLLIPRVSLTNTTTWGLDGTFTDGMLVYNANTAITGANANGQNFYVWQGNQWQPISASSSYSGLGNMGTARYTSTIANSGTFTFPFNTYRSYRFTISGSLTTNGYHTFTDEYVMTIANNVSRVSIQQNSGIYTGSTNAQTTMPAEYDVASFDITASSGLYTLSFEVGSSPQNMTLTNASGYTMYCVALLTDLW